MADEQIMRGARYRLDDEGVIHGREESSVPFEIADAVEAIELIRKIAGGRKRCLLMDISKLRTMSREARAYFQKPELTEVLYAVALVINSPLSRAIGNFFLGLNKAATPTRLFNDEAAAIEWLRPFLKAEKGPT